MHKYAPSLVPGRVGWLLGRGLRTWPDHASYRPTTARNWAARVHAALCVCGPWELLGQKGIAAGPFLF